VLKRLAFWVILWYNGSMENTTVTNRIPTENVVELKNRITELEALVEYYEEQFRLSSAYMRLASAIWGVE